MAQGNKFEKLKREIFEANIKLNNAGLVIFTFGNVSGIDRDRQVIAIKPSGVDYDKLSAEDMVIVGLDGQVLDSDLRPSSDTSTHLELYKAFPEIGGVAHTHSRYATAAAQAKVPISCLGTTHADYFYGDIPCTEVISDESILSDYEKETGMLIANTFTGKKIDYRNMKACLVACHGPFTWGKDAHEAVFIAAILEVHGNIFAAPAPKAILEGIKAANGNTGVILLYNNYSGDVFNFDIAQDCARKEGILVDTVLINDEISSAPIEFMDDRRGTTADHIIIKIAGSAAQSGMDFESIKKLLKRAIYNSRSLGVSLSACTLPETGLATFTLEEGKMEFGMGLHGEAGIKKVDIMTADQTVKSILDLLIKDLPFQKDDEVVAMVNGYGATTRMEMFIVLRGISVYLKEKGISIYASEIGEFCTSQEMAGISITLIKLDDEIKKYYNSVADSPGYKKL